MTQKQAAKNKTAVSAERSATMRAVKSKNTTPELLVRSVLHRLGFRFRLHNSDLPGKPDIVLPRYKTVIRIMGCFWHGHDCARGSRMPKTNKKYWQSKIQRNAERDARQNALLQQAGWRVIDLWECELKTDEWMQKTSRMIKGR